MRDVSTREASYVSGGIGSEGVPTIVADDRRKEVLPNRRSSRPDQFRAPRWRPSVGRFHRRFASRPGGARAATRAKDLSCVQLSSTGIAPKDGASRLVFGRRSSVLAPISVEKQVRDISHIGQAWQIHRIGCGEVQYLRAVTACWRRVMRTR